MQRPISLTLIAWLSIVVGVFGVIGQAMLPSNPMAQQMLGESPLPMSVHMAIGVISGLISIATGYGILKGLNWSRYLYVGWSALAIALAFATSPFTYVLLLSVAVLALFAFLLFRAPANAWFTQGAPVTSSE
jgi:hypothetical protein